MTIKILKNIKDTMILKTRFGTIDIMIYYGTYDKVKIRDNDDKLIKSVYIYKDKTKNDYDGDL
jgi:hypothetical protein